MTEKEMKIIQQEEQRLRDEASAHAARALAATDEVIRRVELHQYDINQFAAVKLYHLQRLLQVASEDPAEDPDQGAAASPKPLISESGMRILNAAIERWKQSAQENKEDGDRDQEYACNVALLALQDVKLSLMGIPAE
ncbi:MAG: hypothetical protein HDT26_00505 [Subdoligranulum sp.]|nr:hypothetical protein [Subdoligranulum sp.]